MRLCNKIQANASFSWLRKTLRTKLSDLMVFFIFWTKHRKFLILNKIITNSFQRVTWNFVVLRSYEKFWRYFLKKYCFIIKKKMLNSWFKFQTKISFCIFLYFLVFCVLMELGNFFISLSDILSSLFYLFVTVQRLLIRARSKPLKNKNWGHANPKFLQIFFVAYKLPIN